MTSRRERAVGRRGGHPTDETGTDREIGGSRTPECSTLAGSGNTSEVGSGNAIGSGGASDHPLDGGPGVATGGRAGSGNPRGQRRRTTREVEPTGSGSNSQHMSSEAGNEIGEGNSGHGTADNAGPRNTGGRASRSSTPRSCTPRTNASCTNTRRDA